MAELRKIRASGEAAGHSGEIRATPRETRMTALRGYLRLPEAAGVVLLYSLLYDPETRVRAIAQEQLSELTAEQISAFIRESGHPRVLDLIARNLDKGSPVLKVIASAPTLPKRSREYLESIGVITPEESSAPSAAAEPASKKADETDSREWTPSSSDVELPEGVEFSMPTDEGQAPEDTSPPYQPEQEDEAPRETEPPIREEQPERASVPEPKAPGKTPSRVEEKTASPAQPGDKLFPVHEQEREKATSPGPSKPYKRSKAPAEQRAQKSTLRRDITLAIIIGILIGITLAAAFVIIDRFVPDWPQRLKNIKDTFGLRSVIGGDPAFFALTAFAGRFRSGAAGKKQTKEEV